MNKLKKILNKDPKQTIFFLILFFILLSAIFITPSYELKVLLGILIGINITWYFSTGNYTVLKYFLSIIIIVFTTSLLSGHLEMIVKNITSTFFPATLFLYFSIHTVFEFVYSDFKRKHLTAFVFMFLYFAIVVSIYTFSEIYISYLPVLIAITFVVINYIFISILKNKKEAP